MPFADCPRRGSKAGRAIAKLGTPALLARDAVATIGEASLEPRELLHEVANRVRQAVRHDASVWMTLDPDSLLANGTLETDVPADLVHALLRNELLDHDVHKLSELARRRDPLASLSQLDADTRAGSRRAQTILPAGGLGDELRVMLRVEGEVWGHASLYRAQGEPPFTRAERTFIGALTRDIATGLRRSMARSPTGLAWESVSPGVVTFSPNGRVTGATAEAAQMMRLIAHPTATVFGVALAASQARDLRTRVRLLDGRWATVHAAALSGQHGVPGEIAACFVPLERRELTSLLLRLHGLSSREREVAELLLEGLTTVQIAARLGISRFTLRDHRKAIYTKLGATRREQVMTLGFGVVEQQTSATA